MRPLRSPRRFYDSASPKRAIYCLQDTEMKINNLLFADVGRIEHGGNHKREKTSFH